MRVAALQLAQQMNDATPDVGRDQLQLLDAAFFDRTEQLIGFAQLAARCGPVAALPGPEAVLSDLENGAFDHDLSSHDNPGMEERVESEEVYGGKLFKVYRDRVRLPSGQLTTREIVRHPGSVGIIPRDASGRIVLVRQFRYVAGRELWEIPAGTLDKPGEEIPAAARRELAEEAGFTARRWTLLGTAYLMPGYCDERMTFFLAEDLSPTESHPELDESFKVNPFDAHDLQVLRASGELLDAKTLLGLAWAGVALWAAPSPR
ncbi:MAG: NUDIX hydrolase [Chloroflexi bacterium]|nr:MAG: NUDIX hydrolase [Chloroflexota bacterium]